MKMLTYVISEICVGWGGGGDCASTVSKLSMLGLHLSTHHDREYVQYMYGAYRYLQVVCQKTKQKGKQLAENQIEKTSEPAQG
jgi:hypothetical protein